VPTLFRRRSWKQFSADGYVVVSTTIDPEFTREVTAASEWANQVLSGSRRGFQQDFYNSADVARHLQYPHLHSESCLALLRSRPVAEVARSVFGDSRMLVTHSKISHKKAGADLAWFPHQDNGYKAGTNEPERRGMTIGIFLEDADERNGTLQVFPGSHRLGPLPHRRILENADGSSQYVVRELPAIAPVSIRARTGDVVAFSFNMIHQSQPNSSRGFRPLYLFELEVYEKPMTDEQGRVPVIVNGQLSPREKAVSYLIGLPKMAWLRQAVKSNPTLHRLYRRAKSAARGLGRG
jgi:phytanoyl-CoA hydroxylase